MSKVELALAFLAGVVMGAALDRFVLRSSSMPGSTDCAGMGDERKEDVPERLTVDHIVPLAAGGAPFDVRQHVGAVPLVQLDEGCVDRPDRGRGSPMGQATRQDRARRLCVPGIAPG